jgi:hypothetical protein
MSFDASTRLALFDSYGAIQTQNVSEMFYTMEADPRANCRIGADEHDKLRLLDLWSFVKRD